MDARSPSFDADALLAQAGYLHSLARELARDAHTADDLVQDTLLTALERPPRRDGGAGGMRGWLATVLRNRARQGHRGDDRRRAREQHVARPEATEIDAGDVEARMLLLRRLADAIAALPEPQRSAVTMRWIDDRSPAEVARAQGISPEAARQRLSRATSMLRESLDRRYRDRAQWSAIALVRPSLVASTTSGFSGAWKGITMSTTTKIAAAAVFVALAVVLSVRTWSDDRDGGKTDEVRVAAALDHSSQAPANPATVQPANAGESGPTTQEQSARAAAQTKSAAPSANDSELHGVVLDLLDRPVSGARIEVRHSVADGYQTISVPDPMPPEQAPLVTAATSADDGSFVVVLSPGRPHALEVHASGFADVHLGNRFAGERVVVHVSRGSSLHGVVTHKSDGTPVVGALVRGFHPNVGHAISDPAQSVFARTDGDGRYAMTGVVAGSYAVEVRPNDALRSSVERIELVNGEDVALDFVVESGRTLKGRVIDAVTGSPIAGALVGESWLTRFVRTDRDGRYEYPGFPLHDPLWSGHKLAATAEGYAMSGAVSGPEQTLDIQLRPGSVARCRVVDRNGEPVGGATVAAWAYGDGKKPGDCDVCNGASRPDGRVEITGLRADLPHVLVVRKEGFGTVLRDFPAEEHDARAVDLGDVVLDPMAFVSGIVVDAKGTPLPDRGVALVGSSADRAARKDPALAAEPSAPPPIDRFIAQRSARTDDQGRFTFADVAPGEYRVRAWLEGVEDPVEIPAHVNAAARVGGLKLVLDEGLVIEGRIFGPDGNPVERASVSTHFIRASRNVQLHAESDAQGRFRLIGVSPGTCDLSVSCWDEHQNTRFAPEEVKRVSAGARDVVVRLRKVARIEGLVREDDGTPAPFAMVIAERGGAGVLPIAGQCQADGTFFIDVPEGDVVDLSFMRQKEANAAPQKRETGHVAGVAAGTKGVVLRFPPR